jgi:hypothetical protein
MVYETIFFISVGVIFLSWLAHTLLVHPKVFKWEGSGEELILLIDIGNGSVSSGLALFVPQKPPQLLLVQTKPFTILEKPEPAQLLENLSLLLSSNLQEILTRASAKKIIHRKGKNLSQALISFSAPWFTSKLKEFKIEEKRAFMVSRGFLERIISKEKSIFEQELSQTKTTDSKKFSVVETSMVTTVVNGQEVSDVLDREANLFEGSVYMSAIEETLQKKILDIIARETHLSLKKVIAHTFPLVSFSVIRNKLAKEGSYLILDITGETTEITLINKNTIAGTASFAFGRHTIIRYIAKSLNLSLEIAASNLNLFMLNKSTDAAITSIGGILVFAENEWNKYLDDALASLSADDALPKKVYITTNSDTAPIFFDFLKLGKTKTNLKWRENLEVVHINEETFASNLVVTPGAMTDEFISMLALFYDLHRQNI